MATVPAPVRPHPASHQRSFPPAKRPPALAVAGMVLAIFGVLAVWPTVLSLWALWTTDPLKSIGGLVPLVSFFLVVRVWRKLGWKQRGSVWGLILLALLFFAVHLRDGAVLEFVVSPSWSLTMPPHSVVAFAYATGMALTLGGTRLWRAARFPLALMLLVNPVPHVFSRFVDLPLQHAAASVARGLAQALGQHLTPDQLLLMFTPRFGMFIAPGCDGIRGAVAMGLLALVAGYLRRLRWKAWLVLVTGAVLLGYAFNLLRLCVLVLYYVVALRSPWLQRHAENADYCLGAALFFAASILLSASLRKLGSDQGKSLAATSPPRLLPMPPTIARAAWVRCASLAVLIFVALLPYAAGARQQLGKAASPVRFPAQVGLFQLQRTWTERLPSGVTIFEWASYAVPGEAGTISLGLSPVLGAHDTLLCHTARGETWTWHGTLPLRSADGVVPFSATFFAEGLTQRMEASTLCSRDGCGQWASERTHLGLVYSRPDPQGLLETSVPHPIPILLEGEQQTSLTSERARARLADQLQRFVATTSFGAFTYRYLRP